MSAFLALVRKDLVIYFSSRRALLISVVAPVLIAAFFGSLFGGAGGSSSERSKIPIAVIDLDRSPTTIKLAAALRGDANFEVRPLSAAEAADAVKRGKLRAVVTLPANFGRDAPRAMFSRQDKPEIEIRYDPSQGATLQVVQGLLTAHVMETVMQGMMSTAGGSGMSREDIEHNTRLSERSKKDLLSLVDSFDRMRGNPDLMTDSDATSGTAAPVRFELPYRTKEIAAKAASDGPDAQYNAYSHAFAGMGVQFILFMGIDLGVRLLTTRRMGLWQRLRAAPVSRAMLLGSQVASGAIIAALLFVAIFAAGILFFQVRVEGSVVGFAGLIVAFGLVTAAFGLCIAALGRTPEATRGIAIFATLVMVMLGGAWVPAFIFPKWLQTVSLLIPTRWAVDGFDAVTWRGLGFDGAWLPIVVLLGFALLFAVVAVWRFRWDEK